MESKIKLVRSKQEDIEIVIDHDHMPQYDLHYMEKTGDYLLKDGKWLPLKFRNELDGGHYDEAFIEVNKKVTYKLSDVDINSEEKEMCFKAVETIFKF